MDDTAFLAVAPDNSGCLAAAELLRAEYLDALLTGDPGMLVSTPGLECDTLTLAELLELAAHQQAQMLAMRGAL